MQSASTWSVYETIEARRDVRAEFTGAPVDEHALTRVLNAAHSAPSVGLTQPWDFVLVRDVVTRTRFRDHVDGERQRFAQTLSADRSHVFDKIKIEGILESSLSIVVTYDHLRGAPAVLGRHAIADAGLYSVCLAIENLWLAATAEELGVGWVSFYQESFVRDLLFIPEHIRPVAWLCVGPVSALHTTPDLERHGWRTRSPLVERLHDEQW